MKFIRRFFPDFFYFFPYMRYRMFVVVVLSFLVGVLDGFGLSMLFPLWSLLVDSGEVTAQKMGPLYFLLNYVQEIGFSLDVSTILVVMLFFVSVKSLLSFLAAYLNVAYLQYFTRKIRIQSIDGLSNYDYRSFCELDSGAIQNSLTGEANRVVGAYTEYAKILQVFVLVVTYSFLAFISSPELSALIVAGAFVTNYLFRQLFLRTKQYSSQLVGVNDAYQGLLIQKVSYFKYLKATAMIDKYASYLKKEVYLLEAYVRKMGLIGAVFASVREPLLFGIVILAILFQVNVLEAAVGSVMLSLLFFYRGLNGVFQLQNHYNSYFNYSGSLTKFKRFLHDLSVHSSPYGENKFNGFRSDLRLEGLHFAYTGANEVLNGINLSIWKNETIAFVGESGSGKTTLMNILSGLLRPGSGNFFIDGVSASEIDVRTFQSRIGYITQDPVIFDDTVFNNVTFWESKNMSVLAKYKSAMEKAAIFDFFDNLTNKEDTRLGNRGIQLSGGQIQRICIARELYKQGDFLFMDEATSALDSKTEQIIQRSIEQMKGKRTIIIIAHRLSTIKFADRVVLFNKGKIECVGNFQELMMHSEAFRSLVKLQRL